MISIILFNIEKIMIMASLQALLTDLTATPHQRIFLIRRHNILCL
jgi:hypothetical protein